MTDLDTSRGTSPLKSSLAIVVLLTALSALGQFSSNIYLPSLPSIAADLQTDLPAAQMTYTVFLAFFAGSQLFYGPLSDWLGRRPVLILGLAIYVIGSIVCTIAPDMVTLLFGRSVQAIGAGAGVVLARAIIRDSFDGPQLTKILALTTIFFALVPGLTPLIGGILEGLAGWRVVLFSTIIAGLLVTVAVFVTLPETNMARSPKPRVTTIASIYIEVVSNRAFMGFALSTAFAIAAMSAFFGGSPAVFISELNVSPVEYGFYPPIAVTGFVIGGLIVRRFAEGMAAHKLALIGACVLFLGAVISLILPILGLVHKHGYNLGIIVTVSGLGILMPTAIGAALSLYTRNVGAASAVIGFLQMLFGAVATLLVSLFQNEIPFTAYPIIMAISGAGAVVSLAFILPRHFRVNAAASSSTSP